MNQQKFSQSIHDFVVLFCSGRDIYKANKNGVITRLYTHSNSKVLAITGISVLSKNRTVAFIEYGFDNSIYSSLKLMDYDTNNIRELITIPALCKLPSLSPDGSKLAFVTVNEENKASLSFFDVQTGAVDLIAENVVNASSGFMPSWNPNGDQVLFDAINCEVSSVNINTKKIIRISNGDLSSLSNDGKIILYREKCRSGNFYYQPSGRNYTATLLFNTKKAKITGSVWSSMSWSQDNRLLCFYTYKENIFGKPQARLYIYDLGQKKIDMIIKVPTPSGTCHIIYN